MKKGVEGIRRAEVGEPRCSLAFLALHARLLAMNDTNGVEIWEDNELHAWCG